jgi:hypothetical protein
MEETIIVKLEAEIGNLKNQLNAAQGELQRFGIGVEQSIGAITLNSLNSQLVQLQKQLSTVDVGSAAFKNIGAEISAVENKVNSALTSISNNANRSKSGFNGLQNSVNQLSRELPAFSINANIGFLAISNNLPILFDEIKRVTAANKELADSGKPTTSVFKQLTGALFSWGTALSLGVTLLTIYGGKIVEMLNKMTAGKDVISSTQLELDALNATYADKSLQGAISDVVLLQSSLDTASKSINGQKGFIEQYNKTIGTVTGSVTTFKEAEQGIVNNTDAYINAMIARATATRLAAKAGEITTQIEDKKVEHAKQNAQDQIDLAKKYQAEYKTLQTDGNRATQKSIISEADYVNQRIATAKAATHKAQKEELSGLEAQYTNLLGLTKKYYDKSGQITPFVAPPAKEFVPPASLAGFIQKLQELNKELSLTTDTKKQIKITADIIDVEKKIETLQNKLDVEKFQQTRKPLFDIQSISPTVLAEQPGAMADPTDLYPVQVINAYTSEMNTLTAASDNLFKITDEQYAKVKSIHIPTEEEKAAALAHTNEVITAQTMLLGALTGGFEQMFTTIVDGGQNVFQGLFNALKQLMIKLAAAIAAAAILFVLTGGLSAGGSKLGSIGQIASKYGGLGFNPFELFGGEKTKSVYMPSGATAQGNVQIDIMGDKMRMLLNNEAIKNSRVI